MKKLIMFTLTVIAIISMVIVPSITGAATSGTTTDNLLNSMISLEEAQKTAEVVDIYFTYVDPSTYDSIVSEQVDYVGTVSGKMKVQSVAVKNAEW